MPSRVSKSTSERYVVIASWRASSSPRTWSSSRSWSWMWFQAAARLPMTAGAAIGMTRRNRSGPLERHLERDHAAQ